MALVEKMHYVHIGTSLIFITVNKGTTSVKCQNQYLIEVQCPLDIATLDKAAALPIATSTPVTDLRHYINSNLVYNDLKI